MNLTSLQWGEEGYVFWKQQSPHSDQPALSTPTCRTTEGQLNINSTYKSQRRKQFHVPQPVFDMTF